MPRVLATVDEAAKEWVESQSDSLGVPEAEIIRRLIDAGRTDESLVESKTNHNSQTDSLSESELIHRIDELEQRVAALEPPGEDTGDADAAHSGAERRNGEEDESPSVETSSGRVEAGPAQDVRQRVEAIAESWDDDDRLDDRIDAGVAVVEYAQEHGSVGKSEAIDEIEPEFSVRGQNGETWWRKNIRPVLQEFGEYDSGAHGYRINFNQT